MWAKIICAALPLAIVLSGCSKNEETTAPSTSAPVEDTAEQTDAETKAPDTQTQTETVAPETALSFVTEAPVEYDDAWETASMGEQILATDENWSVTGKPVYKDGYMGVDGENMFDVTYLSPIGPEEAYRFEFELNTAEAENDEKWATLFVGLKINSEGGIADEDNGLWISFKNGVMGIKGATNATWNEGVSEFELPYSFTDTFRRICIEDDRASNTIKIYQADDDGFNVLAYKLQIEKGSDGNSIINVFSWKDNFEKTAHSLVMSLDLTFFNEGYVKLWNHNRSGVYVKNLAVKVI